jgi:HD superfamily phosphohydrolase
MFLVINPRKRFDIVKDPVHGYIRFTRNILHPSIEKSTEADLINSIWLQRLRRIHQLQTAWYVYPAADHSRFSHALGVMELAGKFARAVYEPFYQFHKGKIEGEPLPEVEHVVESFRIAGLLHDVGHGPFTHMLDRVYLKNKFGLTHEVIAEKIITSELKEIIESIRRSPDAPFERPLDVFIISRLIKKGGEQELDFIWKPLHQIIRGAYDADKMDFLLRDGMLCWESGITKADVERLIFTSFFSSDGNFFLLHHSSLHLLMSFIRFRQRMLETVYYHPTVRAIEIEIEEILPRIAAHLLPQNPVDDLDTYAKLDEYAFFYFIESLRKSSDQQDKKIIDTWDSISQRKIKWKRTEEFSLPIHQPRDLNIHLTASELSSRIENDTHMKKNEHFIVDSPPTETPGNVFSFSSDLSKRDKLMIFYEDRPPKPTLIDDLAARLHIPIKVIPYRLYTVQGLGADSIKKIRGSFMTHLGMREEFSSLLESSF